MTVNMFTNSRPGAERLIVKTSASFFDRFGEMPVKVYCDVHPDTEGAGEYIDMLRIMFGTVIVTDSLSDGYIKAVESCTDEHTFMLEHDWLFLDGITHSLDEICEQMRCSGLMHMRFNKRDNKPKSWDTSLRDVPGRVPFCLTDFLSNNPHIIDVGMYRKYALPRLKRTRGKKGIEHELQGVEGAIYGPIGYPATIQHIGR